MSSASIPQTTDKWANHAPRVVQVSCPMCGRTRDVTVRFPSQRTRAANRHCRRCQYAAGMKQYNDHLALTGPSRSAARLYRPDPDVIDWVIVHRLVTGVRVPYSTKAERVAAVAELTATGLSAQHIAGRMGITQRTVVRLRADIRTLVTTDEQQDNEVA